MEISDGNTKTGMNEVWIETRLWESTRRNHAEWHILVSKALIGISETNKLGGTQCFHEDLKSCTPIRPQYK